MKPHDSTPDRADAAQLDADAQAIAADGYNLEDAYRLALSVYRLRQARAAEGNPTQLSPRRALIAALAAAHDLRTRRETHCKD